MKKIFIVGAAALFPLVLIAHDTDIIEKIFGKPLPAAMDPLRRAQGYRNMAKVIGSVRNNFNSLNGNESFIIANHYGLVGEISFYLKEAKEAVTATPLAYYMRRDHPVNQFYFWPDYGDRVGQNAIFVDELSKKQTRRDPPPSIVREFERVVDLGVHPVLYKKREMRRLHLFGCYNLLPQPRPVEPSSVTNR